VCALNNYDQTICIFKLKNNICNKNHRDKNNSNKNKTTNKSNDNKNKKSFDIIKDDEETRNIMNDINPRNTQGYTPLHLSCKKGDDKMVMFLLQAGADVSAVDAEGRTPFHLACMEGQTSTLRILVLQTKIYIF
jgi:ankyrin repeat protein